MAEAASEDVAVHPTGVPFFDRLLGGGLVEDGVYLVAGDPGGGKSSLLAKVAGNLAARGVGVLYVSAEETRGQVARRARRLRAAGNARVLATTSLAEVVEEVERLRGTDHDPDVLVIDSVQALSVDDGDVQAFAGSVVAVRELGHRLVALAKDPKDGGRVILAVVQVVKDGGVAGPKALSHAADALYFLENPDNTDRFLGARKDRFSGNLERVTLEMTSEGLRELPDPAAALLADLLGEPGVVAFPAVDDARVRVVPIEASVSEPGGLEEEVAPLAATGFPAPRLKVLLDLLKQHAGLDFTRRTVRVEVPRVAGVTLRDEGLDLAVAAAVVSAWTRRPAPTPAAWGRVGLSGRTQLVVRPEARMEALGRSLGPLARPGGPLPPGRVAVLTPRSLVSPHELQVKPCTHLRDLAAWLVVPPARPPRA